MRSSEGNAVEDSAGYRIQGGPRHQNRQAASGASKVVIEDVGELQFHSSTILETHQGRPMRK